MKRTVIAVISLVVLAVLVVGTPVAMADKPQDAGKNNNDVIERSNGFPSGAHFNLNIHGKNDSFTCDPTPGGNSIFVDECGNATIQYVTNKKSSVEELTALDPCAVDEGTATVQLPYEALGYYVFARILGKPNNSSDDGEPSSIILYPNEVVEACNDTDPANPDFPYYTECPEDPLLALGLIIKDAVYEATPEEFVRFADPDAKGKGKSKAVDITRLFTYEGWVVDARLDLNDDGVIDVNDIPVDDYDGDPLTPDDRDYNNDGDINDADVEAWLTDSPMAWYFSAEDNMWILNIADLVVTEQGLVNDGTKLLQIRFYPVATTEFTQQ